MNILITGVSSGIGKEIAKLQQRKAKIWGTYCNNYVDNLADVRQLQLDHIDEKSRVNFVRALATELGEEKLSLLYLNAGGNYLDGTLAGNPCSINYDAAEDCRVFALNGTGPVSLLNELAAAGLLANDIKIVLTSSIVTDKLQYNLTTDAGELQAARPVVFQGWNAYTTGKEFAERGVVDFIFSQRQNGTQAKAVLFRPGFVATGFYDQKTKSEYDAAADHLEWLQPDAIAKAMQEALHSMGDNSLIEANYYTTDPGLELITVNESRCQIPAILSE